jgi:TPR repeat protein
MRHFIIITLMVGVLISGCKSTTSTVAIVGGDEIFDKYKGSPHYRAFAMAAEGAGDAVAMGGGRGKSSVKEAIAIAVRGCKNIESSVGAGKCKLYAVGDIIVEGMSSEKINKANAFYSNNKSATNETFEAFLAGAKPKELITSNQSAETLSKQDAPNFNAETAIEKGREAVSSRNYIEAVKWFRFAAEQGNSNGENYMGFMYIKGFGVPKDYNNALQWLQKAADKGHPGAQLQIGYLYVKGWGVNKSYGKAIELFRKLADQGYAPGQNRLGLMFRNGWGVDRDYDEAEKWFRKGAAQGNKKSKRNLKKLLKTVAANNNASLYTARKSFKYSLYGKWEGMSDNVSGDFTTDRNKGRGKLQLNLGKSNPPCLGQWMFAKGKYGTDSPPQGTWSVACSDGLTATGTYTSHKQGQGLIEGEDSQKRKINMYFN